MYLPITFSARRGRDVIAQNFENCEQYENNCNAHWSYNDSFRSLKGLLNIVLEARCCLSTAQSTSSTFGTITLCLCDLALTFEVTFILYIIGVGQRVKLQVED